MKSIIQNDHNCYLCRTEKDLTTHHMIEGTGRRVLSEKYGLKIYLCHNCHRRVQTHEEEMKVLRKIAQLRAMSHYKWTDEDFIKIFGRSFIHE